MNVKVLAEIGANHGGSTDTALKMTDVAAECGAWGVKGQVRGPDYLHESLAVKPYTGPNSYGSTYGNHRAALELHPVALEKWGEHARSLGLQFGLSVWSSESVNIALDVGADFLKVPSCESGNLEFVREVCSRAGQRPVIASCGFCDENQIVDLVKSLTGVGTRVLMHCVSAYPCDESELRLDTIPRIKSLSPIRTVGFSDHSRGISMSLAAAVLGATWIERHFTLDRTSKGTDHAASLEPTGLKKLCRDLAALERARGVKVDMQECERGAYRKLARTAVACSFIEAGQPITPDMVRFQACGLGDSGLRPEHFAKEHLVARHSIAAGSPITDNDWAEDEN